MSNVPEKPKAAMPDPSRMPAFERVSYSRASVNVARDSQIKEHIEGGELLQRTSLFRTSLAYGPLGPGSAENAYRVDPETAETNIKRLDDGGFLVELAPGIWEARDDDGHVKREGTWWLGTAHIVTAVIGSGVLSLQWSTSWFGWIAGPIILLMFAFITLYCVHLLCDVYRFPTPDGPKRNYRYMDAVKAYLSPQMVFWCGLVQYVNLIGTGIGYTVTAGISVVAIRRAICFHSEGHQAACAISNNPWMILFGALQILFSQIPDFDRLWFVSIVAAIMSLSYSGIGLGLAIGKATDHAHHPTGSVGGRIIGKDVTSAEKIWGIFSALGNIAFAYNFLMITLEIEDTMKKDPPENVQMKKASNWAIAITTFFYMSIGTIGYAAFGNDAPGNLLTGFGFFNPYWLVAMANAFIFVHLVGAYQVYTQPYFAFMELTIRKRFPKSKFLSYEKVYRVPLLGVIQLSPFRLVWRTLYVCFTTVIAMILPFFNAIVGLLGAIGFFPLTVYFPVKMNFAQRKEPKYTTYWWWHQALIVFCLVISLLAGIGSVEGIVEAVKNYTPFHTSY